MDGRRIQVSDDGETWMDVHPQTTDIFGYRYSRVLFRTDEPAEATETAVCAGRDCPECGWTAPELACVCEHWPAAHSLDGCSFCGCQKYEPTTPWRTPRR